MRVKFRSVLAAAVEAGCNALVMPDAGCGVYKNEPKEVGRVFGEVLQQDFWGALQEVALVGNPDFQDAVVKAVSAAGKAASVFSKLRRPSPSPSSGPSQEPPPLDVTMSESRDASVAPPHDRDGRGRRSPS